MLTEIISLVVYIIGIIVTAVITTPKGVDKDDEIVVLGWFMLCIVFPIYWFVKCYVFVKILIKEFL